MAIRKRSEITFTAEEFGWIPGSFWVVRLDYTTKDEKQIADMIQQSKVAEIDPGEVRRLRRQGLSTAQIAERFSQTREVTSIQTASLAHMSIAWGGPEFMVPEGHQVEKLDEDGNVVLDKRTKRPVMEVDEYAGQLPPCTIKYIDMQEAAVTGPVYRKVSELWAGKPLEERKKDKEALFRAPVAEGDAGAAG